MNEFQQQLFNDLIELTKTNEAFYHQTFLLDDKIYLIFNYRLASYTDFMMPNALNCRGTMFEVDADANPVRLAALPICKFFNDKENPYTMDLDYESIEFIEDKLDGSLISTFIHDGKLRLKSKGSLFSQQAIDAAQWLMQKENDDYRHQLYLATDDGFTVDLEWCSPTNRIVLGYEKPQLVMLHMRDNDTGEMYHFHDLEKMKNWIAVRHLMYHHPINTNGLTLTEFVKSIPSMTGIEGYVVKFKSGKYAKIKTDWYCSLHHTKDSVNNPRRLFEAILDEAVDDLRSMFYDDPFTIRTIDLMQEKVDRLYNHMVSTVELFWETNKQLDRKSYAIKGQQVLDAKYFPLAMEKYLGKDINFKQYLKNRYKEFGICDEKIIIE